MNKVKRIYDGRKNHKLYNTYNKMLYRCYKPQAPYYEHYGGRGIKVCDRWLNPTTGVWNFYKDVGDKPSPSHTLDRIDNNKDYSPSNCRWATPHQQAFNRNNNNDVIGVSRNGKSWLAYLVVNGEFVLRETHKEYKQAVKARRQAELKYL